MSRMVCLFLFFFFLFSFLLTTYLLNQVSSSSSAPCKRATTASNSPSSLGLTWRSTSSSSRLTLS